MIKLDEYRQFLDGDRAAFVHRDWLSCRKLIWKKPAEILALPGAHLVSDARHATVIRVPLRLDAGDRVVYYKYYHVRGVRDWLRSFGPRTSGHHLLTSTQALTDRGFDAPLVVAFGHRRKWFRVREVFSATAAIEPSLLAPEYFRKSSAYQMTGEQLRAKREQLSNFGGLIRRLHDSGIAHSDLHGGNILIQHRLPQPRVIFLEQAWRLYRGPIPLPPRIRNFRQLNRTFGVQIGLTDRLRVLRGYDLGAHRFTGMARRLAEEMRERMLGKLKTKTGVTIRTGRFAPLTELMDNRYRSVRYHAWRGYAMRDVPRATVIPQLVAIGEQIRAGRAVIIKHRPGRTAAVLMITCGTRSMMAYVKEDRRNGWDIIRRLKDHVRGTRPWVTWQRTLQLRATGVAVQRPVAYLEERRWGMVRKSVYVGEYLPVARSLEQLLSENRELDQAEKTALWQQLAGEIRRLHDQGFSHGDLKGGNILVERHADRWSITFIDLEGVAVKPRMSESDRAIDLGRFWMALLPLTEPVDREQFLNHYAMVRPRLNPAVLRDGILRRVTLLQTRRFDGLPAVAARLRAGVEDKAPSIQCRRWVVIALGAPHEVLQMTPLLNALRREFPVVRLDVLVRNKVASLLAHNGDVEAVLALSDRAEGHSTAGYRPISLIQAARTLNSRHYGVAIDLTSTGVSAALTFATVAPVRIGYRIGSVFSKWLKQVAWYTQVIMARPEQRDLVHHYLLLGEALGIRSMSAKLHYTVTPEERREVEALLNRHGAHPARRLVILDLAAPYESARWPPDLMRSYVEFVKGRLECEILLVGRQSDSPYADELLAALNTKVINLVGQLLDEQLAAVMAQASLVVSGAPETIELAAAIRTPAIYLKGGGGSVRTAARADQIVLQPYCYCQGRMSLRGACARRSEWCMREILPDRVFEATRQLLKQAVVAVTTPSPG